MNLSIPVFLCLALLGSLSAGCALFFPTVDIDDPVPDGRYKSSSISVSGTLSGDPFDRAECYLDGYFVSSTLAYVNDEITTFSFSVSPGEGRHEVTVKGYYQDRYLDDDTVSFVVDRTSPAIAVTSPGAGSAHATNRLSFGGTASDNDQVSSVSWEHQDGRAGSVGSYTAGAVDWSTVIGGLQWTASPQWVKFTANDSAGNASSATIYVTCTNPAW